MKLKYKQQQFQTEAAQCVTDVFRGQPYLDAADYILDRGRRQNRLDVEEYGFANARLMLDAPALAANVRDIQQRQGLRPVASLEGNALLPTFSIEMETGTGKTYTYIKTLYELNRHYGWTKFIVVVPSVAIREGVLKSFSSMEEHFVQEYGKRVSYFVYNSRQLQKLDEFASSNGLHVMIINTQAFNRSFDREKGTGDSLIIFDRRDEFGSRVPINVIAQMRPIIIIDEPQTVLGKDKKNKSRQNLQVFNPLFLLQYSATHRKGDDHNMVYRLDALDAYNRRLVKKIEVKGIQQEGSTATHGYLYLDQVVLTQGNPQARLGFDQKTATGVRQVMRLAGEGFDLHAESGGLAEYEDHYVVERIDGHSGTVTLLNGLTLTEKEMAGQASEEALRRIQIRETIKSHLERERQLFPRGIKVLSLFFIDHVKSYRDYEAEDEKGLLARMFEEEYQRALEEFATELTDEAYLLYLRRFAPGQVHSGYFSQDKKGRLVDSAVKRGEEGSSDEGAYDLIMRDKERLLSLDEPVRFLFSHSALKEGWDNPNVFQICTLKSDGASEIKRRQEVGRGMRLCVNSRGERQDADVLGEQGVFDTNVLTVVASQSYESFAKQLQEEIAASMGDRPVQVTAALFDGMEGVKNTVVYRRLLMRGYIDDNDLPSARYHEDKRLNRLDFGEDLAAYKEEIVHRMDSVFNPDSIKPGNSFDKKAARFRQDLFKEKFQQLWQRINVKSHYRVDFSSDELVEKAVESIDRHLRVTEIHIVVQQGAMEGIRDKQQLQAGTAFGEGTARTYRQNEAVGSRVRYDLVGKLVEATGLMRRTIVRILQGIRKDTFAQYRQNPEEFIIKVGRLINEAKASAVIEKITYQRGTDSYDTDIFTANTLRGKVGDNAFESAKSLYDLVVVDSKGVELEFGKALEHNEEVEVFTKLPRGFYINTPMGHYNPDWAVVFREGTVSHVYFIAETKGSLEELQLRPIEKAKIDCARKHFAAISGPDIHYDIVTTYQDLYDKVLK